MPEDLSKILNKRFIRKYTAVLFLLLTCFIALITMLFRLAEEFCNKSRNYNYTVFVGVLFCLIGIDIIDVILYQRKYERNLLIEKLKMTDKAQDTSNFIEEYLRVFANGKMGYLRYVEYVFWFSREIRFLYLRHGCDDKRVYSLYTGLRYNDRGDNIAAKHKEKFICLCKNILKKQETGNSMQEICTYIYASFEAMAKEKKQLGKSVLIMPDKNILYYLLIIICHIIGCLLIGKNGYDIGGNLLLCIPTDFLIILIYKGYILEKEMKEDREKEQERR